MLAGLILALSISYKVTPALFVFYFLLKGSWRAAGATVLGMGIFLLIVPSLVIGPELQRRMPGDVVAPDAQPLPDQRGDQPARDQPVDGRRLDPALDRDQDGRRPLRRPPRPECRLLAARRGRPAGEGDLGRLPGPARPLLPDEGRSPRRPEAARRILAGRAHDALPLGAELEAPLRDPAVALYVPDGAVRLLGVEAPAAAGAGGRDVGVGRDDGDDVDRAGRPVRPPPGAQDRPGLRPVPLGGRAPLRGHGLAGLRRAWTRRPPGFRRRAAARRSEAVPAPHFADSPPGVRVGDSERANIAV